MTSPTRPATTPAEPDAGTNCDDPKVKADKLAPRAKTSMGARPCSLARMPETACRVGGSSPRHGRTPATTCSLIRASAHEVDHLEACPPGRLTRHRDQVAGLQWLGAPGREGERTAGHASIVSDDRSLAGSLRPTRGKSAHSSKAAASYKYSAGPGTRPHPRIGGYNRGKSPAHLPAICTQSPILQRSVDAAPYWILCGNAGPGRLLRLCLMRRAAELCASTGRQRVVIASPWGRRATKFCASRYAR
jgi:hypothetical protein